MKLATLDNQTRDGSLLVVSSDNTRAASAAHIAPTLQAALDSWDEVLPRLTELAARLNAGEEPETIEVDAARLHSPLPRAYEWIDGSAYINHVVLVRKARGAEPPETLKTDPLIYQGGSGVFLRPTQDITFPTADWGIDFESEVAVVVGDVPRGTKASEAGQYIRLLLMVNDITLRNIVPAELAKGFGFFVSKPSTTFGPFAVTPDELGGAWKDLRVHLPLHTWYNGELFGDPEAGGEMFFSFGDLIEHITRTRALTAGTIIGSGTVSNEDRARGSSCLAEKRMIETIEAGKPSTPFMQFGDTVAIEMLDRNGRSVFGRIEQRVRRSENGR
jgi:fumarylacetoacetate (FAA) hydrolase